MLLVVSPAKSLDYDSPLATELYSEPRLLDQSQELVEIMAAKSPGEIKQLMGVSEKLAELNFDRFQDWQRPFDPLSSRAAVLAFNGDVYTGLDATSWTEADFDHSQTVFRILSGLYGVLRPLDLMMAYRLEMGTKLANSRGKDLYAFWRARVTETLREDLAASPGDKVLVNLASKEYFRAVDPGLLEAPVLTPTFLDSKNGGPHKVVSFFAKRARGAMSRFVVVERITAADSLHEFDGMGYRYDAARSSPMAPVFLREN